MKTLMILGYVVVTLAAMSLTPNAPSSLAAVTEPNDGTGWKLYTNARFGFSVRYPDDWRLGNPLPDGVGVTLSPTVEHSLVAVSGHMNIVGGTSQDGRQTTRRVCHSSSPHYHGTLWKKTHHRHMEAGSGEAVGRISWETTHLYLCRQHNGRGDRTPLHVPRSKRRTRHTSQSSAFPGKTQLMPLIERLLATYQPGRDQNAVSPLVPKPEPPVAPR